MLSCTYEVVAIDGDYAHLRRNDIEPEAVSYTHLTLPTKA